MLKKIPKSSKMSKKNESNNKFMDKYGGGVDEEENDGEEYGHGPRDDHFSNSFDLGNKDFTKLEKLEKNFFVETPEYKKVTDKEVKEFLKKSEINVFGDNVPKPFLTFTSAGFPDDIEKQLTNLGFKAPTSIQSQAWPICLKGKDVIALAETGSGKTLGFLIPAIIHLRAQKKITKRRWSNCVGFGTY